MERLQSKDILKDLQVKMVFLSGPRQVGKTVLAKSFKNHWQNFTYLNYDSDADRRIILRQEWDRKSDIVILDEVHKLKKWKTILKGIYDTEGIPPRLLVTGSARLDVYRRGGDSLAGRYFLHRLYPFSVRELRGSGSPQQILQNLNRFGGFPEPYLGQSERSAARWRKQHLERIIRIDVQDLEPVKDIQTLILLIDLLRERVGKTTSYASLAGDLEISPHTVKRWVRTLENMYILFAVTPYHKNIGRAILKEPKIYFYDSGAVIGDEGAKLENTVAVCLRKHLHYLEDTEGKETRLHYVRDKEKREVDFLTVIDGKIQQLMEVKLSDPNLSPHLLYYHQRLKPKNSVQLVMHLQKNRSVQNIQINNAAPWLDQLTA